MNKLFSAISYITVIASGVADIALIAWAVFAAIGIGVAAEIAKTVCLTEGVVCSVAISAAMIVNSRIHAEK